MNSLPALFSRAAVLLVAATTFQITLAAKAAETFRYSLAKQQEYGLKRGFQLLLEDSAPQIPRKTDSLRLILAVADGKTWRFPTFQLQWQWEHAYQVKAIIGPQRARLWVDGQLIQESVGAFAPSDQLPEVRSGLDSRKMDGWAEYLVRQTALRISTDRNQIREFAFTPAEERPLPVFAFEPQTPVKAPLKLVQGETITIEATFQLEHAILIDRPNAFGPLVDRFGQSKYANWPDKVRSEDDLNRAAQDEVRRQAAYGIPANFDQYGGSKNVGWRETPTGFFRTTQRNGFWWLITPDGNPCFYLGLDSVVGTFEKTQVTGREQFFEGLPAKTGAFAPAWGGDGKAFGFTSANLIRKHGANWEGETWKNAESRLRTWGFSGLGKWSGINTPGNGPIQMPSQPVIRRTGVPTLGRMPDIFDPTVRATFRTVLERAITPHLNNPFIIGWSVGNEHEEVVLRSDMAGILKRESSIPAKRALVAFGIQNIYGGDAAKMAAAWKIEAGTNARAALENATMATVPASDIETLRRHFADEYYGFIYRTVKAIDPNHLYCAFWIIPGWWEDEIDWHLGAKHADVVGFDYYKAQFGDERTLRLLREAGKPAICGEFSFPSWYGGRRGAGSFEYEVVTPDDASSGARYASWVEAAARNPYMVGMHYFQYRDQPITGRGISESLGLTQDEHFAFGLIDITDRPKWDMIDAMRRANLGAASLRQRAAQETAKTATKN